MTSRSESDDLKRARREHDINVIPFEGFQRKPTEYRAFFLQATCVLLLIGRCTCCWKKRIPSEQGGFIAISKESWRHVLSPTPMAVYDRHACLPSRDITDHDMIWRRAAAGCWQICLSRVSAKARSIGCLQREIYREPNLK